MAETKTAIPLWNSFLDFTVGRRSIYRHLLRCETFITRKPSYRWQTRTTRKAVKNCSNSTCLQCCHWQYWPNFV